MSDDCLFCKIVAGDIPADKVYEDERILAFNDISPQAPTHILVIPKEHIATVNDLAPEHSDLIGHMVLSAQKIAKEQGLADDGYRLIMNCNEQGGQTVYHIHLHILGGRQLRGLG
ncbi:MAG: histidine triad nucleotide-binding protein [Pseudomonadales bacterium]